MRDQYSPPYPRTSSSGEAGLLGATRGSPGGITGLLGGSDWVRIPGDCFCVGCQKKNLGVSNFLWS